ncbi:SDR family NAD(P)-dependent oxidoreductase [Nocardia sp. NPDC004573]
MPSTIVMTGASRGIGRVAAQRILRASPQAHLVVAARGSTGARLAAELGAGGRSVSHVEVDLGAPDSVRSAAAEIRGRLDRDEANLDGALSFVDRLRGDEPSALPPATTTTPRVLAIGPSPTSTPRPTPTTSSAAATSTSTVRPSPSATSAALAPSSDGWYDLVEYQSVSWANGFDPVDPIRIGAVSFPSSIVGYYPSSASDPMNRATWTIGGQCDRFSVWIGKDSDSPSSAGVGRFVVRVDDQDAFTAEKSMSDPAEEVNLDISGKIRLTLFDARRSQDAKNAWGRPRVHCSAPPGRKR